MYMCKAFVGSFCAVSFLYAKQTTTIGILDLNKGQKPVLFCVVAVKADTEWLWFWIIYFLKISDLASPWACQITAQY